MISAIEINDGGTNAAITSNRKICGKHSIVSTNRINTVSMIPPLYPATNPITAPVTTVVPIATSPTVSDIRPPYSSRDSVSRPNSSVPNQNPARAKGATNRREVSSSNGSCGAMNGENSAARHNTNTVANPNIAIGCRRNRPHTPNLIAAPAGRAARSTHPRPGCPRSRTAP